jgi:biopolymer transport protein ExbD
MNKMDVLLVIPFSFVSTAEKLEIKIGVHQPRLRTSEERQESKQVILHFLV